MDCPWPTSTQCPLGWCGVSSRTHTCSHRPEKEWSPYTCGSLFHRMSACSILLFLSSYSSSSDTVSLHCGTLINKRLKQLSETIRTNVKMRITRVKLTKIYTLKFAEKHHRKIVDNIHSQRSRNHRKLAERKWSFNITTTIFYLIFA